MDKNTVEIKNIGAIDYCRLSMKPGMNLVVGRNGKGKSTALKAMESLVTRNASGLSVRDGTDRGTVEGFGTRLSLRNRASFTGDAEISLSGTQNDLSLFVTGGGYKDLSVRDEQRLRAALGLFEITADMSLFEDLVGGREVFESLTTPATRKSKDAVEMADRFRQDMQREARKEEAAAETEQQRALTLREASRDVDLSRPDDQADLIVAVQQAMEAAADARTRRDLYDSSVEAKQRDHEKLEQLNAQRPDVPEMQRACEVWVKVINDQDTLIADLDGKIADVDKQIAALQAAKQNLQENKNLHVQGRKELQYKLDRAHDKVKAAESHLKHVEELTALLSRPLPPMVTAEEVEAAKQVVQEKQEAAEYGAIVRRAKQQLKAAEDHERLQRQHVERAEQLRAWGRAVDELLSERLVSCGLPVRWSCGRLQTQTSRGWTNYDELGEGERWCLPILVMAKWDPTRILIIPQECWEALDPPNQALVDSTLVQHGMVGWTGKATADEGLNSVPFTTEV